MIIGSQWPTPDGTSPCVTLLLHWPMQLSSSAQSSCQGGNSKFYYSLGDAVARTSLDGESKFSYSLEDVVDCTSVTDILYSLLPPC